MFDKDNKFGFINNNESNNNNLEGLDNIKTDINNIKGDLGDEELTTVNKDIKGAINEVNAQYKDIVQEVSQPITLNKCDSEMLAAIQNKEGETVFELSSVPRDESVTFGKLDQDSIDNIAFYEPLNVTLYQGYYDDSCKYDDIKTHSNYMSIKQSCCEGEMYSCDCKVDTQTLSTVIFYKQDKTRLKSLNTGIVNTYLNYKFSVPKDAYFFTITSNHTVTPILRKLKYRNVNEIEGNMTKLMDDLNYSIIKKRITTTVELLESNTELLEGKLYISDGNLQTLNNFSTLYCKLGVNALTVNLSAIKVGTNGGAFITKDKVWISSFATDGANEEKEVPKNAYYIAITVPTDAKYAPDTNYGRYFIVTADEPYIQFNKLNIDNLTNPYNHWRGKKMLWLGTSVSFGQYATKSYVKEACDILECNFLNVSMPGLAIHTNSDGSQRTYGSLVLSKSEYAEQGVTIEDKPIPYTPGGKYNNYWRTYENVFNNTTNNYDLYVFDVVPNNNNFALDDWNVFDKDNWAYSDGSSFAQHRTTFLGALLFLLDKLYEINPKARIVFVLGSEFSYNQGKEALQAISDKYRIGIIDIWSKINLTPKSKPYIFTEGGTNAHPSTYAHELLGKILANELLLMS